MVRLTFITFLLSLSICVNSLPHRKVWSPKALPHAFVNTYALGDCSDKLGKNKMIRNDKCTNLNGPVGSLEVAKVGWGAIGNGEDDIQLSPLRECGVVLFPESNCRGRGYGIGDFNSTAHSLKVGKYKDESETRTCVPKPDELAAAQSAQILCYRNKFAPGFQPETSDGFYDQIVYGGSLWSYGHGPIIDMPCGGDCSSAEGGET